MCCYLFTIEPCDVLSQKAFASPAAQPPKQSKIETFFVETMRIIAYHQIATRY